MRFHMQFIYLVGLALSTPAFADVESTDYSKHGAGPSASVRETVQKYLDGGGNLLQSGQYQQALDQFSKCSDALESMGESRHHMIDNALLHGKIDALVALGRYEEALELCRCLDVGSLDCRPFSMDDPQFARLRHPFLLRSQILLKLGKRQEAISQALMALHEQLLIGQPGNREKEWLGQLHVSDAHHLKPIRTGNRQIFKAIDDLTQTASPTKENVEKILARPLFPAGHLPPSVGLFDSADGLSVFQTILYRQGDFSNRYRFPFSQYFDKHSRNGNHLILTVDADSALITEKDLERKYGKSFSAQGATSSYRSLAYNLNGKTVRFLLRPNGWKPTVAVSIFWPRPTQN